MTLSAPQASVGSSLPSRPCDAALLIVGHGTRDAAGVAQFLTLVREVADLCPDVAVEPSFLELAQPSIAEGVDRAVLRGARRLTVMPLLLFAAGHAKHDIPRSVAAAARRHVGLEVRQAGHLGCHSAVLELSERRFREAVATLQDVPDGDTLLLLVGRGSNDAEATGELHQFARLRGERQPFGRIEVCFLAMAEPSLEKALYSIAGLPFRRVVVQPHLLFSGELLDRLRQIIAVRAAAEQPGTEGPRREWVIAESLGSDAGLALAVVEISSCVGQGSP